MRNRDTGVIPVKEGRRRKVQEAILDSVGQRAS